MFPHHVVLKIKIPLYIKTSFKAGPTIASNFDILVGFITRQKNCRHFRSTLPHGSSNMYLCTLFGTSMWIIRISKICKKYAGILQKWAVFALLFSVMGSAINCGLLTWGYACDRLTNIQKRMIRTITGSKYCDRQQQNKMADYESLYSAVKIMLCSDWLTLWWNLVHDAPQHIMYRLMMQCTIMTSPPFKIMSLLFISNNSQFTSKCW